MYMRENYVIQQDISKTGKNPIIGLNYIIMQELIGTVRLNSNR